ncbi:hypothetical protein CK203_016995 [Vitis vinifera]|uniref:Retrotransposon Copia-like N-terminal domain-containing protein n=1 Tax=Vitis vinifera TaxID=29760 RepID=A0A438JNL9_VITVI|nr:hypothetical protein CK203_070151 [Vitis vinifera]RVX10522.1 hypothetical protein CK203_016995 [Vitis vinifera]
MAEVMNKASTPNAAVDTVPIGIKLDGSNYALWSQVVEMFISKRDKLGTENTIVKGWLINTMDSSLISTFIRYPTTKEVWDAIAVTFFDGSDIAQVYELRRQEERVYVFIDDLDDRLDQVRSTVLQMQPFFTIEQSLRVRLVGNGATNSVREWF